VKKLGFPFDQIERDEFRERQPDIGEGDVGQLHHIGVHHPPGLLAGRAVLLVVKGEIQFLQQPEETLNRSFVNLKVSSQLLFCGSCRRAEQINRPQHPHHLLAIHRGPPIEGKDLQEKR